MVSAIVAGVSAAASIAGGAIKSARAKRTAEKNQQELSKMKADNQNFFNRYYNADATQLADNRAALTEARENLVRNSSAAAGRNAVAGGTNATSAAAKEANNQAYANAVRGVAADAQQYKNAILNNYQNTKQNLNQQQMQVNTERNNANASAIDTAVNGVGKVASAFIAGNTEDDGGVGGAGSKPKEQKPAKTSGSKTTSN